MQRWYRTFPHGLSGIGLLLLRTAVALRVIIQASSLLLDPHSPNLEVWAFGILGLATGAFLMLGFLTPLVAGISVLAEVAIYFWHPDWALSILDMLNLETIVVTAAIGLLGPGSISLDAYFFGRRKVVIPRIARS